MELKDNTELLVNEFKNGNTDTFVDLMNQVREPIYKIIYAIVGNEQNAIEVFDDVIYKAYINLKKLNHAEFFKTWITRIAINESKNYLKKNSKIVYMDEYEKEKSQSSSIEDKLDFESAIDSLDIQIKSVIIMKCYMNFTFDEIATSLDKSTSTIKTWYYKGLDILKGVISKQEEVTSNE